MKKTQQVAAANPCDYGAIIHGSSCISATIVTGDILLQGLWKLTQRWSAHLLAVSIRQQRFMIPEPSDTKGTTHFFLADDKAPGWNYTYRSKIYRVELLPAIKIHPVVSAAQIKPSSKYNDPYGRARNSRRPLVFELEGVSDYEPGEYEMKALVGERTSGQVQRHKVHYLVSGRIMIMETSHGIMSTIPRILRSLSTSMSDVLTVGYGDSL